MAKLTVAKVIPLLRSVNKFMNEGIQGNPDSGDEKTTVDWDMYDKCKLGVGQFLQKYTKKSKRR
jgi:hypothetical protein